MPDEARYSYSQAQVGMMPSGVHYGLPAGAATMDMDTLGRGSQLSLGNVAFSSDPQDNPLITRDYAICQWPKERYHENIKPGDLVWFFDRDIDDGIENGEHRPIMLNTVQLARFIKAEFESSRNQTKLLVARKLQQKGFGIRKSNLSRFAGDDGLDDDEDEMMAGGGGGGDDDEDLATKRRRQELKRKDAEQMKRFQDLMLDSPDPIINLDELEWLHRALGKNTSESVRQDYMGYLQTINNQMKQHEVRINQLQDAEREAAQGMAQQMGGMQGQNQRTFDTILSDVSEDYRRVLDDYLLNPSTNQFAKLYQLRKAYDDNLMFLSPTTLHPHCTFVGACLIATSEEDSDAYQLQRYGTEYNVIDQPRITCAAYGKARIKNVIHPTLKLHEQIHVVLTRKWDEEKQCYTHVIPTFTRGYSLGEGHFGLELFSESYRDHLTGKRIVRTDFPWWSKNSYFIGTVDKQETHAMKPSVQQYEIAQGVFYDNRPIEESYAMRRELPDMTIFIRQGR